MALVNHVQSDKEAFPSGLAYFGFYSATFRTDAELRSKWVLRGGPATVASTSPMYGEKASYYSAVCLETAEVEWMDLEGNSNSGTSAAFQRQLRDRHSSPLMVIRDNAPAHRGEAVREYLRTPGLHLGLVNLPGYSPDFNGDEAIWGWAREAVQGTVGNFLAASPVGKKRSRGAAGPYCNPGPKVSPATHSLIPLALQMHIPPWL